MPRTSTDLEYTTSTRSGQPEALVTPSSLGTIWLTEDDLVELLHAVRVRKAELIRANKRGDT